MGAPRPCREVSKRYHDLAMACKEPGRQSLDAGPLGETCRELVKLGISIGARLEGAVHAHTRLALERGATPDEVLHVARLAGASLGPLALMAVRGWVLDAIEVSASPAARR